MSGDFMSDLESEAADLSTVPSEESGARLRKMALELVATDASVKRLERELETSKARRLQLAQRDMPDLMAEIGQDRIGLPDVGEFGVDLVSEAYAHASIGAEWDDERRAAAFSHLDALGAGDLIKNFVQLQFNRGDHAVVRAFVSALRSPEFLQLVLAQHQPRDGEDTLRINSLPDPSVAMSVPWNTLTSYVKEQVARGVVFTNTVPDDTAPSAESGEEPVLCLPLIGATVGTIVKIKPRKG